MNDVDLGNPNLKKANTPQEFTKEQIEEFIKCKEDPVYFAKNYVKIVTLDHGLQPFKLYDFQEKLVNRFHKNRFNICKMPRQTGKSTTCVSYLLHYAVFNDSVNIGILRKEGRMSIFIQMFTGQKFQEEILSGKNRLLQILQKHNSKLSLNVNF